MKEKITMHVKERDESDKKKEMGYARVETDNHD
jgi:hypothetical protein